jgi:hypothetical protein
MSRWTVSLCVGAALLAGSLGCLSAETSEASQLTRLEHGIDVSTTAPDRYTARGDVPGEGKPAAPASGTPASSPPPATTAVTLTTGAPAAEPTDDDAPRPTIRIWGAPSGRSATTGFVPVSKIVYDAGPNDPPATGRPATAK